MDQFKINPKFTQQHRKVGLPFTILFALNTEVRILTGSSIPCPGRGTRCNYDNVGQKGYGIRSPHGTRDTRVPKPSPFGCRSHSVLPTSSPGQDHEAQPRPSAPSSAGSLPPPARASRCDSSQIRQFSQQPCNNTLYC